MRSSPQGKSSPHGRITSVNRFASVRLSATAPQGNASLRGRITSVNGLASVRLTATAPQGKASHRDANTSRNGLGTCGISSQHGACSKLVTLKAIPASFKLGNSLSLRGCTPIYQRLPYCVGMFCRFFKIHEAKQIKQETRNFGKIAKARAKNLRAFAIFSEVSGFLLDLLCFLDLEKFTKHPHTVILLCGDVL